MQIPNSKPKAVPTETLSSTESKLHPLSLATRPRQSYEGGVGIEGLLTKLLSIISMGSMEGGFFLALESLRQEVE